MGDGFGGVGGGDASCEHDSAFGIGLHKLSGALPVYDFACASIDSWCVGIEEEEGGDVWLGCGEGGLVLETNCSNKGVIVRFELGEAGEGFVSMELSHIDEVELKTLEHFGLGCIHKDPNAEDFSLKVGSEGLGKFGGTIPLRLWPEVDPNGIDSVLDEAFRIRGTSDSTNLEGWGVWREKGVLHGDEGAILR